MTDTGGRKKTWGLLFRLGFFALSIGVLIRVVDVELVLHHIGSIPVSVLAVLVGIALLRTWLTGLRWQLVNPDASDQLSSWKYFQLVMMAKPFNLIMPGALGGDFVRTALTLRTVRDNRVDNVIAIIVDRFVGLFSITALGITSLAFVSDIPDKRPFYVSFAVLCSGFAGALVLAGSPFVLNRVESLLVRLGRVGGRLNHVLERWREAVRFFARNYQRLLVSFALCLPIHVLSFVTTYLVARTLGVWVSFLDICTVLSLVWVITAVPITISGAGVRELSMIYFLSLFGVPAEPATALSVYLYAVTVILGAIGLGFVLFAKFQTSRPVRAGQC